jgi:hypothetical protein
VVPLLAKHQTDLCDLFGMYAANLSAVKAIVNRDGKTATPLLLAKRVLQAKTTFYRENYWAFRALKLELKSSLPDDIISVIQQEMDVQALVYAFCLLQQLAIESLAWRELDTLSVRLGDLVRFEA